MADDVAMIDVEDGAGEYDGENPEIAAMWAASAKLNRQLAEDSARYAAQAEAEKAAGIAEEQRLETMGTDEAAPEEGEFRDGDMATQPTKVNLIGLDNLDTFEVKRYVEEHFDRAQFKHVQWVNDTAANLVFRSESAAAEALIALSAEECADPLRLRPAKPFSASPNTMLHVRQAIETDAKVENASNRSKFYLFNKQWDPDNPDNIRPGNRKRRLSDHNHERSKYRRRNSEQGDLFERRPTRDRRSYRDREDAGLSRPTRKRLDHYDESMYDEGVAEVTLDEVRRGSNSSGDGPRRLDRIIRDDLYRPSDRGRLRDRSLSPARDRDGDGRYGFGEDQPRRDTARPRSSTPAGLRERRDRRAARDNPHRELFPERHTSAVLDYENGGGEAAFRDEASSSTGRELFPNRPSSRSSAAPARELFPDKLVHKRSVAQDISPLEVAEATGRRPDHNSERYGGQGRDRPKDLFSRITSRPQMDQSYGRLRSDGEGEEGLNVKGAARTAANEGFSILGASKGRIESPLVKELFPLKAKNDGGTDLFDGRIKGRARRKRAEDLN